MDYPIKCNSWYILSIKNPYSKRKFHKKLAESCQMGLLTEALFKVVTVDTLPYKSLTISNGL